MLTHVSLIHFVHYYATSSTLAAALNATGEYTSHSVHVTLQYQITVYYIRQTSSWHLWQNWVILGDSSWGKTGLAAANML